MGTFIKLGAVAVVAVLATSVLLAWRDARKEQMALQAELKMTQQALTEATARQASRDAAVNELVAGLKKKEAAVQKPEQVVAALLFQLLHIRVFVDVQLKHAMGWRVPIGVGMRLPTLMIFGQATAISRLLGPCDLICGHLRIPQERVVDFLTEQLANRSERRPST